MIGSVLLLLIAVLLIFGILYFIKEVDDTQGGILIFIICIIVFVSLCLRSIVQSKDHTDLIYDYYSSAAVNTVNEYKCSSTDLVQEKSVTEFTPSFADSCNRIHNQESEDLGRQNSGGGEYK